MLLLHRVFWFVFSLSFIFAWVPPTFDSFLNSLSYSFTIIHLLFRLCLIIHLSLTHININTYILHWVKKTRAAPLCLTMRAHEQFRLYGLRAKISFRSLLKCLAYRNRRKAVTEYVCMLRSQYVCVLEPLLCLGDLLEALNEFVNSKPNKILTLVFQFNFTSVSGSISESFEWMIHSP